MSISLFIDLIIILIFIAFIYSGFKKGLIKSVMGLVGIFVAFIFARIFSPLIGAFINLNFLSPALTSLFANEFGAAIGINGNLTDITTSGTDFSKVINNISPNLKGVLDKYSLSDQFVSGVLNNSPVNDSLSEVNTYIIESFVDHIIRGISIAIAFVFIFAAVMIIVSIITLILDSYSKLPVINSFNKLGGVGIGALKGILFILIIVSIINGLTSFIIIDGFPIIPEEIKEGTFLFKNLNIPAIYRWLS